MAPQIGHVSYEPAAGSLMDMPMESWRSHPYGEATAAAVDDAVRRLLDTASDPATAILAAGRPVLDHAAQVLLERETLSGDELAGMRDAHEAAPAHA